ncbi:RNA-dependent RNA polymerase, partial [Phenoliferia sp. Uapishka_3]
MPPSHVFVSGLSTSSTTASLSAAIAPHISALATSTQAFVVKRIEPRNPISDRPPHAVLVVASENVRLLFLTAHGRQQGLSGIEADGRELRFEAWITGRPTHRAAEEEWLSKIGGGAGAPKRMPADPQALPTGCLDMGPIPIILYSFGSWRGEKVFAAGGETRPIDGQISFEKFMGGQPHFVVRMKHDEPSMERSISSPLSNVSSVQARRMKPELFVTFRHPPTFEARKLDEHGHPSKCDRRERRTPLKKGTTIRFKFGNMEDRNSVIRRAKREGIVVGEGPAKLVHQPSAPTIYGVLEAWMRNNTIPVSFQVECLLQNSHLDGGQLLELIPYITKVVKRRGPQATEKILVRFKDQLINEETDPSTTFALEDSDDDIVIVEAGNLQGFGRINRQRYLTLDQLEIILKSAEAAYISNPSPFSDQSDNLVSRHVVLRPTGLSLLGPLPEDTNAISRKYNQPSQFLRVAFRDEDGNTFRELKGLDVKGFLESHVGKVMRGGLSLCGRRFELLAWSSSSLKDHIAYFVTPFNDTDGSLVTAHSIRSSIGNFSKVIHNPAKYMARVAQVFSSSKPSITLQPSQIILIPDIETKDPTTGNISCHSDGCGLISPALARDIDKAYSPNLSPAQRKRRVVPSVYQIRLGGAKGVVSVDPTLEGRIICIRPSMSKFDGNSLTLDICSAVARPLPAYLNRPLIKILEDLCVEPSTIIALQKKTLAEIGRANKSFGVESDYIEELCLAQASRLAETLRNLSARLPRRNSCEPFLDRCLAIVGVHARRELKYRGRIPLPGCYQLIGVTDPGSYLQPGEVYACIKEPGKEPVYLEGHIAISRSPTMHPGDIQLVRAVGQLPEVVLTRFSGLENCVVFSSQGPRSLPSCLAGGDLDGDLYLLITNPSLFPTTWAEPASYEPCPAKHLPRDATIDDGIDFFLEYMLEERTGRVATAHLALADIERKGVFSPHCLELANRHSDAVDYAKSGVPVPGRAIPFIAQRPDYLSDVATKIEGTHYYKSQKVLGVLFRSIDESMKGKRSTSFVSKAALDPGDALQTILEGELRGHHVSTSPSPQLIAQLHKLLDLFADELRIVCRSQGALAITEEEAFVGCIEGSGAKEDRPRRDLTMRMRERTSALFDMLRSKIKGGEDRTAKARAKRAWAAYLAAKSVGGKKKTPFGAGSFGWLAVSVLLESLEELDDAW